MVDSFSKGRVIIAGGKSTVIMNAAILSTHSSPIDAGHVHSPTGGQGVNTAIQDSFNLGWKLALVARGYSNSSLITSYTEERLPVIAEMLDQTTKLLNKTFKGEDEGQWKPGGTLFQLGVNYRWSSIVMDERKTLEAAREAEEDALMEDFDFYEDEGKIDSYGSEFDGRLRAGDRAPDSSGLVKIGCSKAFSKSYQLFQIFNVTYHTILLFADFVDCEKVLQEIQRYPKDLMKTVVIVRRRKPAPPGSNLADYVFEDYDGHAYEAYTSSVCGLVVVRPDGVVGGILRDASSLRRYFQTLLVSQ